MKTTIFFLLLLINNILPAQSYQTTMYEYTYFEYPEDMTLYDAIEQNKIIFDTVTYLIHTQYQFNLDDSTLTYIMNDNPPETYPIITISSTEPFLSVDVLIKQSIYNYLFCRNINAELGMFVRNRISINGQIEGFYTNNLELK